jgi:hypothetical protein
VLITYVPPLMCSCQISSWTKWNFKKLVKNNPSIGSLPDINRNILAQGMNILSNFDGHRDWFVIICQFGKVTVWWNF